MTTETRSLYSQLPAIDRLLRDSSFLSLRDTYGHTRVVELLRQMLDEAREVIQAARRCLRGVKTGRKKSMPG